MLDDEIRYKITVKNKKITKESVNVGLNNVDLNTIILLLESPHKYEYNYTNGVLTPIGPAQGDSISEAGGAIDNYICNVLEKIDLKSGEYYLVISNPIQFQTSLYSIHKKSLSEENKKLRDLIWRNIWEEKQVRDDFINRIGQYNSVKIINACTKNLKDYVSFELSIKGYKSQVYITSHPSVNWNVNKKILKFIN